MKTQSPSRERSLDGISSLYHPSRIYFMLSTNLAQPVFQSMQLQRAKPIAALWVRNTESDVNDGSGTGHMTTLQVPTIEGSWMKH